jgi:hypothetical protein
LFEWIYVGFLRESESVTKIEIAKIINSIKFGFVFTFLIEIEEGKKIWSSTLFVTNLLNSTPRKKHPGYWRVKKDLKNTQKRSTN